MNLKPRANSLRQLDFQRRGPGNNTPKRGGSEFGQPLVGASKGGESRHTFPLSFAFMPRLKKIGLHALKIYLWAIAIGAGLAGGIFVATQLSGGLKEDPNAPAKGPDGAVVGQQDYIGRGNCDQAIKKVLLDPESFQRDGSEIVDVKRGEGWVARTTFRSRNGFGGYEQGSSLCVFDGKSYRALMEK
jgi:hypothetical protein